MRSIDHSPLPYVPEYITGNFELARSYAEQSKQKDSTQADVHVLLGNLNNLQGKFHEALVDYSAALKASPDDSKVLFNRACTHDKMGNLDLAVQDFRRATELDSSIPETFMKNAMTKKLAADVKGNPN